MYTSNARVIDKYVCGTQIKLICRKKWKKYLMKCNLLQQIPQDHCMKSDIEHTAN